MLRLACIVQVFIIAFLVVILLHVSPSPWNYRETALLQSASAQDDERVTLLMDLWTKSLEQRDLTVAPRPPHLTDCKRCSSDTHKLDSRGPNGEWPPWTHSRGALGVELGDAHAEQNDEEMLSTKPTVEGPNTPWIQGGDEDNLPMTRRAQRDIWLHQHPRNCNDSKFLLAEWQSVLAPGVFGAGAEMVALSGWLAIAMKEKRVLVTTNYHGANHSGCTGSGHFRWSCYFVPEASQECIDRALQLAKEESAWKDGVIKGHGNYPPNVCLTQFEVPQFWGQPWESTQKTVEINGELLSGYEAEHRRWWRAQAFKYLMRFPSEHLCQLLNRARHEAFGKKAAMLVASSLPSEWPKVQPVFRNQTPIEKLVWSASGPWIPRPLLSLHVRQGDKAREMEVFDFQHYMQLCEHLRTSKPHVRDIWLSTEMQNVVEESVNFSKSWNFYFTSIERQTGTTTMTEYMASLGKQKCFDNSFVNLFMAADSDYFVGALGSTWSCLIDSLRMTSGKNMAGFLTVNSINRYL